MCVASLTQNTIYKYEVSFSDHRRKQTINVNYTLPAYPAHWGPPPHAQTRDFILLPGEYGRGSSTLRHWILEKMAEDDLAAGADDVPASTATATTKKSAPLNENNSALSWPDKNLVGMTGDEAKVAVLAGNTELLSENIQILPSDAMVTMDFREDRVRIFVGEDGNVVRQPNLG